MEMDVETLKNEKVTHKRYGNGKIIDVQERFFTICFESCDGYKKFIYPDAFDGFLIFENTKIQQETKELICQEQCRRQIEESNKRQEYERLFNERKIEKQNELKKQRKLAKETTAKKTTVKEKKVKEKKVKEKTEKL